MGTLWGLLWTGAHGAEPAPAPPPPSPEELRQDARRLTWTGGLELGGGLAALAGGTVLLLVGRGEPGSISTETQATSDMRSVGGAGLIIGGLAFSLVGGNTISRGMALREQANSLQVSVAPGGLRLQGRF
jgi:hypothetical protein